MNLSVVGKRGWYFHGIVQNDEGEDSLQIEMWRDGSFKPIRMLSKNAFT